MITQYFPKDLGTITCIVDSKEKHSMFFIINIYKNKGSMTAILDFTITATDTRLKMCAVHLLTSKMYV